MVYIVQGNHILNDAIGMALPDTRLHHIKRHALAEETADEDCGRITPRALFAERGVHRPEQQPIPAPIHPKGDAPVERRLVCGQRIVLLFGIESLPILGTEAHKPVQRTRRGPAHFSPGLHLRPVLAVKTQGLRFAA